jgi:hypothetical protein
MLPESFFYKRSTYDAHRLYERFGFQESKKTPMRKPRPVTGN